MSIFDSHEEALERARQDLAKWPASLDRHPYHWTPEEPVRREVKEVTVAEIHEEFDTAVDRLVQEANSILEKEVKKEAATYKELEKLGFTNAKSVRQAVSDEHARKHSAETLAFVKKYQAKYPKYKFIDNDELIRIRMKYKLIQGKPNNFIGVIPPQNAQDILDLRIDAEDRIFTYKRFRGLEFGRRSWTPETGTLAESKAAWKDQVGFFKGLLGPEVPERPDVEIIATYDQMNIRSDQYVDSRGAIQIRITDPDPIVVTPVIGGWLIVTKWGAEADIEEVQ